MKLWYEHGIGLLLIAENNGCRNAVDNECRLKLLQKVISVCEFALLQFVK